MRRDNWKHLATEGWIYVVIAVLAFVGGLLVGDLGSSPKTETVAVAVAPSEAESESEGAAAGGGGEQIFTAAGCGSCHVLKAAGSTGEVGPNLDESLAPDDNTEAIEEMIVKPNAEVIEGYAPNVMPQDFGQTLSPTEVTELSEFLVESTPASP
ncbi:MAG: cytochrome c [Solirubrobacterales bacterium]